MHKVKEEFLPMFFERTESRQVYDIYIVGEIKDPKYYTEVLNIIQNAASHDIVNIFINSCGGHLWTAMQFVSAITKSEAQIHASIEGEAHSAASFIFLACDDYSVPEFASMLCHYFTSGYNGKGDEIVQWSHHIESHYKNLVKDIYKGFLTETELEQLVGGKDFWLTGKDIVSRVQNKVKLEEDAAKAELQKEEKEAESVQPKKKNIKKTTK